MRAHKRVAVGGNKNKDNEHLVGKYNNMKSTEVERIAQKKEKQLEFKAQHGEVKIIVCSHARLNEDGICRNCGKDCRGG